MERLLRAVEEGEEVVIVGEYGPVARLVAEKPHPRPGSLRTLTLPPLLETVDGRPARMLEALDEDREDRV